MNFQTLQYFITVAESQSFSRAAQKLYISQSALSQAIVKAESELGAPLINRNTNNFNLTVYGEIFLKHAQKIMADMHALHEEIENKQVRVLDLAVLHHCADDFVSGFIDGFRREYGEHFRVSLKQGTYGEVREMLKKQEAELAFCMAGNKTVLDEALEGLDLGAAVVYCVMSAGHRLARRQALELEELRSEKLAATGSTVKYYNNTFREQTGIAFEYLPGVFSPFAASLAAALGECVFFSVQDWSGLKPQLACVPVNIPHPYIPGHILCRNKHVRLSGVAEALWNYAAAGAAVREAPGGGNGA